MNPWVLLPWLVPGLLLAFVVLQLALGMTWGRGGNVWHIRRQNPRGYWLSILAQTIAAALIIAILLSRF